LALALTLLSGATIDEACLFLVPLVYALWAERPSDPRALREVALVAALPVALYLYQRLSIGVVGERYQPGYTGRLAPRRASRP
jgi:hypothetical protein